MSSMNVPIDCISEIIQYLDYKDLLMFSLTCKDYCQLLKYNASTKSKFQNIILKYSQYLANQEIKELLSIRNKIILCAPMSWGKTITALYYAFKENTKSNIAIVVPPNVFKVWMKELTRLKLYNADQKKSQIFILHSSRSHHIPNNQDIANIFLSHRVFLTTTSVICRHRGHADIFIIDEGHKINLYSVTSDKKLILTAERDNKNIKKEECIFYGFVNKERLPNVDFAWWLLNDKNYYNYGDHHNDMVLYKDDFKVNLIKCISQYEKTCIFVDRTKTGDLAMEYISTFLPEYKLYYVKGSLQSLERHLKHKGKSILFLSSMANDGINLLVDNIIIIKPDLGGIQRINQTFGRIMRTNNPHDNVTINIITNGTYCVLKIVYAITYSNLKWAFGYNNEPSADFLLKCQVIAKLVGYDNITNINYTDYAIIFDSKKGQERGEQVLLWWEQNKTIDSKLTPQIIKYIYT